MKKLLAVLLSIMMLAMPLTSMAENSVWDNAARQETTITIHDLNADLVAGMTPRWLPSTTCWRRCP